MNYLNAQQLAERLDKSIFTIQKMISSKKLPGRKVGGTWVMTEYELAAYQDGRKPHLVAVYDVSGAAQYLGVSIAVVRRLVAKGDLRGSTIDKRGRFGGTMAFTENQLNNVKEKPELLKTQKRGPKVQDDIDKHIEIGTDGRYYIPGTKNQFGKPLSYAFLFDARARARLAFDNPPKYAAGTAVYIKLEKGVTQVFVVEDVTEADAVALLQESDVPEAIEMLLAIRHIAGEVRKEKAV